MTAGNGLRLSRQFVFRPRCRDVCGSAHVPHGDKTVTVNDITVKICTAAYLVLSVLCKYDRLIRTVQVSQ